MTKEIDRSIFKLSPEEVQQHMHFRKRGFKIENKKGKGSYRRHQKHKERGNDNE